MKIKIFAFLIVIFSFISGIIGGIIAINYLSVDENGQISIQEIIKSDKNINITNLQNEVINITKETSESVVSIIGKKDLALFRTDPYGFFREQVGSVQRQVSGGTGFFITNDGYILTNKHVIEDRESDYKVVTSEGVEYDGRIIAVDPLNDLAVMKIDSIGDFRAVEFIEKDSEIKPGQFAIAIGNALAKFQNSVTLGIVSGKNRSIEVDDKSKLNGLIQTDAAINPGNSGGPLVNLDGKVIGINTAIVYDSNGLGFSIPLNTKKVDYILNSIKTSGKIKRPFLGISSITLNKYSSEELNLESDFGNYVAEVLPDTVAENAGLKAGDVIIEADGTKLENTTISDLIQNKIPGDEIDLKILRGTEIIEKTIKIGEL